MSFPKKGKKFPTDGKGRPTASPFAQAMSAALAAELRREGVTIKSIARWADVHERTVKVWLSGRYGPSGDHLVGLLRYSDLLAATLLRLADRPHVSMLFRLHQVRGVLSDAVRNIDQVIGAG